MFCFVNLIVFACSEASLAPLKNYFYSYKNATEFDFDKDKYDIRIPEDLDETTGKKGYRKQERMDQIAPESDYSLRVCMQLSLWSLSEKIIK